MHTKDRMLGGFQTRSGQDEVEKYPFTRQKSNPCHPNRSLFYTDRDILAAVTKGSISTVSQFHDQAHATVKLLTKYDIGIWLPFTIKRIGSTFFIRELWFASRHIFKSCSFYITEDNRLNSILQPLRITKTENVTYFMFHSSILRSPQKLLNALHAINPASKF